VNTTARRRSDADLEYLLRLGARIRAERLRQDISQAALASAAGIARNFFGAVERGRHGCDVLLLIHIARALDVPAGTLGRRPLELRARPTSFDSSICDKGTAMAEDDAARKARERAAATLLRAQLDQARAAADEAERVRKSNERIQERIRREGR
jgi:transcriptional regulator with XRE-family HTH domain